MIVDGVSFAPHSLPDVAAIGADVYLFSLYKTYSVHQGLMVVRAGLMAELPNQSHFFNDSVTDKRLNPAGPDHAQVASAGAVLDYVEALHHHHGGSASDDLHTAATGASALWRAHEDSLTPRLLDALARRDDVRLLGPATLDAVAGHRCPTVAFSPLANDPQDVAHELVAVVCRPAPVTTTQHGCWTGSASIPIGAWFGSRSCTTHRPPTWTAPRAIVDVLD